MTSPLPSLMLVSALMSLPVLARGIVVIVAANVSVDVDVDVFTVVDVVVVVVVLQLERVFPLCTVCELLKWGFIGDDGYGYGGDDGDGDGGGGREEGRAPVMKKLSRLFKEDTLYFCLLSFAFLSFVFLSFDFCLLTLVFYGNGHVPEYLKVTLHVT